MEDYREMYLTLMRATEQVIRVLVEAQRKCEELYLAQGEDQQTAFDPWQGQMDQRSATEAIP